MGNLMDSMKKAQEIAKQAEVVNKELMETIIIGNGKIYIYIYGGVTLFYIHIYVYLLIYMES
jgi:hypothetical protein